MGCGARWTGEGVEPLMKGAAKRVDADAAVSGSKKIN